MAETKVISHRGANRYAPQNTLPAFRKSIQLGVDGFETDVHMTRDGIPVICHNYTIDETSTGMGNISSYTLEELKQFDFGSYFDPRFAGTPIPTLDEFLDLTAESDIEIMNIELKSPKEKETGIVQKTIEAVKRHNLFDRLIISSFDYRLLVEAKQIDSNCKTGYLYCPNQLEAVKMIFEPIHFAKKIGADALHPMYSYVNSCYVKRAHRAGIKVNVWTIDDELLIDKMLKCGVDGIITDCPDRVKSIMAGRKPEGNIYTRIFGSIANALGK
ncbi:MAG: glycerophosphodiester phosphodiesterase [Clostridiales bacterium]|nr:glycerophosphodiester phosphodiesterase [Clostridiales bacterium]